MTRATPPPSRALGLTLALAKQYCGYKED